MKNYAIIIMLAALVFTFTFQACSSTKKKADENKIYWVKGTKADCEGVAKMICMLVHKGENLEEGNWTLFYDEIQGFNFEPGILQKIEVKEEHLDLAMVPADASSIKYTLVNVLEKKEDEPHPLNGQWTLVSLNDQPLNRKDKIPTISIDIIKSEISGSNGCNHFKGNIASFASVTIKLGELASTKKLCMDMTQSDKFDQAISNVVSYSIIDGKLSFYNMSGKNLLSFIRL